MTIVFSDGLKRCRTASKRYIDIAAIGPGKSICEETVGIVKKEAEPAALPGT
jgi:hypothetical protein